MTEEILALVGSKDLWIADRNFCTTSLLFGIAARDGFFVIRQHGSTLTWKAVGDRVSCGRCETGAVSSEVETHQGRRGDLLRAAGHGGTGQPHS